MDQRRSNSAASPTAAEHRADDEGPQSHTEAPRDCERKPRKPPPAPPTEANKGIEGGKTTLNLSATSKCARTTIGLSGGHFVASPGPGAGGFRRQRAAVTSRTGDDSLLPISGPHGPARPAACAATDRTGRLGDPGDGRGPRRSAEERAAGPRRRYGTETLSFGQE